MISDRTFASTITINTNSNVCSSFWNFSASLLSEFVKFVKIGCMRNFHVLQHLFKEGNNDLVDTIRMVVERKQ